MAGSLLAACQGPAATDATAGDHPPAAAPTSPPPGEPVLAASQKTVVDSTAAPAAEPTVPFVGQPNAGAVLRAAGANATPH